MDFHALPEIITDTSNEAVVDSILRGLPDLRIGDPDRSEPLRLTRWSVNGGLEVVADRLRREEPAAVAPSHPDSVQPELDVILAVVRTRARKLAPGRNVVVERDRDATEVGTNPHVKIGLRAPESVRPDRVPPGDPRGPVIAVADAQVGPHEDLAGRTHAWQDPKGPPLPRALAHATFVAGTVLRHAQEAQLVCRPVLVHGDQENRSWDVAERLMAFLRDDVAVLNMSFGCHTDTDDPPFALARAIARLAARTVLVAAGGNDASDHKPVFPAALDEVVGVGAVTGGGDLDPEVTPVGAWVDVRAPGLDVTGPVPRTLEQTHDRLVGPFGPFPDGYARWSGSSFAAARVTGEIAGLVAQGVDPFAARDRVLAGKVDKLSPVLSF